MPLYSYGQQSLPYKFFGLRLAAEGIVDIDQVVRQFVVALIHDPEKDVEIMNAIENEGLVFLEIVQVFHKHARDIRVM